MAKSKAKNAETRSCLLFSGQEVEWQLLPSSAAKKLRIKVGLDGIVVIVPEGRDRQEAATFLADNQAWVVEQLSRARKLRAARRPEQQVHGRILYRGEEVTLHVVHSDCWSGPTRIVHDNDAITVTCGRNTRTAPSRSLENWLRKKARGQIERLAADVGKRLSCRPHRIYVMGQRTKWGNCSSLGNLSFNWRLIMAPDAVLRYIVIHEMVHLVIPDHSRKFWFTVQSLCRDSDRARQWLVTHGHLILSHEMDRALSL